MIEADFIVGSPEEWKSFAERNPLFIERRHRVEHACNVILDRPLPPPSSLMDKFVFFAGHRITDDYMEIVILAGNGEGRGAQKLLRPMFEQLVTLKYLIKNPDHFDHYWNYFPVDRHRRAKAVESTLGAEVIGAETMAQIKAAFDEVKPLFQVPVCEKCGTFRVGHAWTQLDLVSMAKKVGVEVFVLGAYYLPLEQSHPKVGGMLSRLVETAAGGIAPAPRVDPKTADEALRLAYGMLVLALEAQVDHFKLDSAPLVKELDSDFAEIWPNETEAGQETGSEQAQSALKGAADPAEPGPRGETF